MLYFVHSVVSFMLQNKGNKMSKQYKISWRPSHIHDGDSDLTGNMAQKRKEEKNDFVISVDHVSPSGWISIFDGLPSQLFNVHVFFSLHANVTISLISLDQMTSG